MTYSPLFFGPQGKSSSRQNVTNFVNSTNAQLAQGTPVYVNTEGLIGAIDVSVESQVSALAGLCFTNILPSSPGPVVSSGRLEEISLMFNIGDPVYISKSGFLTNIKPNIGVAGFVSGDFVVLVGVVVQNEYNPSLLDIQVLIEIIGQL